MTSRLPFTPSSFPSCTRGVAATSPKGEAENGEDSCMAAVWGDKISSAGDVRGDSVFGESGSCIKRKCDRVSYREVSQESEKKKEIKRKE